MDAYAVEGGGRNTESRGECYNLVIKTGYRFRERNFLLSQFQWA